MFRVPKATMPAPTVSALNASAKQSKEQRHCAYSLYRCTRPLLDSYSYCLRHILEDSNAPFKPCSFIYNVNGRKCQHPAPKLERRDVSYCAEHARRAQSVRNKSNTKHSLPESAETLILGLRHYVKPTDPNVKPEDVKEEKVKILKPFAEIDSYRVNAKGPDILDYASSSDSDVEPTLISDTVRGTYLEDSDNESLHSPEEDPLRHAGVYTAEEVVYIAREKLMRLQSLYIDQFKRLQYTLREKRRKYLHALKKEKETLCSIHAQVKDSAKEKKIYEKLKALNSYHRRSGVEAILYKKSIERRAQVTEGPAQKPPSMQKCIFTEGGVKCGERTLPSSKYCRKHILKDQNQVLFKACGAIEADMQCHEPVPVIFDTNCVFHAQVPKEIKLEPMKVKEEKPEEKPPSLPPLVPIDPTQEKAAMEIDVVGDSMEIDPDDDMAGIMREMNDVVNKTSTFNESIASETSTDTAFSLSAQVNDKDDLVTK
ncbi:KAT8 regulatory NSL complex subunit 2 [Nasonia vitripennis]|uniref:KAT8 regulatory NSL complex subunit 2 n=1 Tax=Nasonia vitripennis TaxID=7425 RepID=A0A7M7QSE1_NASVI|nr:KAT8 regulatory NSL complex subunit 2 [Nasonia vitripennis]XP_008216441.1 KAT8 regulatory NSL complex subunit 2 [Nasonia vitripennis]XP_032453323.1 KAT8 regulatory NSL complex subunit 2 [Nasonia vitripennis]XP_032453324.1 KAT8 regulatory NSL complex subunit 2 [Nasonia vitripennis]